MLFSSALESPWIRTSRRDMRAPWLRSEATGLLLSVCPVSLIPQRALPPVSCTSFVATGHHRVFSEGASISIAHGGCWCARHLEGGGRELRDLHPGEPLQIGQRECLFQSERASGGRGEPRDPSFSSRFLTPYSISPLELRERMKMR